MKTKLTRAFESLRKNGYFAQQNFLCCQSCAWEAVPNEFSKKAVFYHAQDNTDKRKGKSFYIAWAGDANEICRIFNECGIVTSWDGNEDRRIKLSDYK